MVTAAHERHLPTAWLCAAAIIVGGGCAAKQPARSFADLQQRLHPGNTVYVTDHTGTERKGKVVQVSDSGLVLDVKGIQRRVDRDNIRDVRVQGDSLWNGMLVGVAVEASAMLLGDPKYEPCTSDAHRLCPNAQIGQRLVAVAIAGAGGAGIDALIGRRPYVYVAPGQPLQGRSAAGRVFPLSRPRDPVFVAQEFNQRTATDCGVGRSIAQFVKCIKAPSQTTASTRGIR